MALTFIDTNTLPRVQTPQGTVTEVLNQQLVGAKNVFGTLRVLEAGQSFTAEPSDKHQLIYVMDGDASITLNGKSYDVKKGAGVYLGPQEGASLAAPAAGSTKLFHLIVPQIPR
jgi:quercetin dioxygenase-like cupin family protein